MEAKTYQIGDSIRLSVLFQALDFTPTDPAAIKVRIMKPSGTIVILTYGTGTEVVRDSAGTYHADFIPADNTEAGDWYYRWEGTGTLQAANEGIFKVRPSPFF